MTTPVAKKSALQKLQDWYLAQCNGDWEHTYGVSIGTLDNPGWIFDVELTDTSLAGKPFATLKQNMEHPTDWVHCSVSDHKSRGACRSLNIESALEIFVVWTRVSQFNVF